MCWSNSEWTNLNNFQSAFANPARTFGKLYQELVPVSYCASFPKKIGGSQSIRRSLFFDARASKKPKLSSGLSSSLPP